jgi:HEXXH motif-containing protein
MRARDWMRTRVLLRSSSVPSPGAIKRAAARYCASPFVAGDARVMHCLIGEYGRALLEIALERCAPLIARHPQVLRRRLARVSARPLPWNAVWDPALAHLERLLARPTPAEDIWDGVVPLLVNLAAADVLGEADVRLHTPQALWWGAVRLPVADRVAFRRDAESVLLEVSCGGRPFRRHLLQRSSRGDWTARTLDVAPVLRLGRYPVVVRRACGDTSYPLPKGRIVAKRLPARTEATFSEVARLLRRVSPALLPWVAEAIRIVVPLRIDNEVRMSATIEEFPGLTFLSLPLDPADVAMRLVHEASHHYFLALQRLSALHDGSDKKNYYSPIKERGRTIDMILFAFHAFGNGALFHRDLARRDPRFGKIAGSSVEQAISPLRILDAYLANTPALTAPGATLWRPIAARLLG